MLKNAVKTYGYKALVAAAWLLAAGVVHAGGANTWSLRAGVAHVSPNDSSGGLSTSPTVKVGVDSGTSLGLTATYMYTDTLGVGVLAAWPFEHDLKGKGALAGAGTIGTVKHLPPTVTLQYHFDSGSNIRPYVGAGINYTFFMEEEPKGTLRTLGVTDVELDDSWGLAAEAGVDIDVNERWFVSGQLWYLDIDTTAKLTGGPGGNVDVDIDPWVVMVGVGTRF